MNKSSLTYKKSGVNIKEADKFVKFISLNSKKTKQNSKYNNIGSFGSVTNIPKTFQSPQIVASTDGVGTKIEIANILKKYDTIGIDLVAMCVNDLIVQGAKPMIFLDYISINKIDLKKLKSLLKGVVKGCKISDCELVGGETAEMPSTYSKGKFDIAGFSAGIVEKKKILYKHKIKKNLKNIIFELVKNTGFLIPHLRNHHILLAKKVKNIDEIIQNRSTTTSKKEFLEIRKNTLGY